MVLSLDDDVPQALAAEIRDHPSIVDLWTIRLGGDR
jgi:hypothetical protein